jgi:DNA primase
MIDLRDMLDAAGVQGLRETKKELVGRCPGHVQRTGHEDRRPSWSVNKSTYLHFCFSCGYKGTLTQLLVDLTGAAPVDLVDELRKQSFLSRIAVREQPEETVLPVISEWAITNLLGDVPRRLLELRFLLRSAVDRYQVRWNPDTRQWVLPLRDQRGELMGAQYRQQGSVLTLPAGMAKSETLFGYDVVKPYDWAVLVESPLDAVRLFGLGIPAFASLGAWVSRDQATLMARCFSYVILALDNDKAGIEASKIVKPMLKKQGCATIPWLYDGLTDADGAPAKDVGDVPSDDALMTAFDRTRNFGLG